MFFTQSHGPDRKTTTCAGRTARVSVTMQLRGNTSSRATKPPTRRNSRKQCRYCGPLATGLATERERRSRLIAVLLSGGEINDERARHHMHLFYDAFGQSGRARTSECVQHNETPGTLNLLSHGFTFYRSATNATCNLQKTAF